LSAVRVSASIIVSSTPHQRPIRCHVQQAIQTTART
jgi:hypothetical protein